MQKIQHPVLVGVWFALAVLLPAAAGWAIASQMGLDADQRETAVALIGAASYLCGAAYLLSHYPMMVLRIRMGLMVSAMSIAGVLAAFFVMPGSSAHGLIALMYLAVIASLPLLLFGAHNVIWAHGVLSAARKKATA